MSNTFEVDMSQYSKANIWEKYLRKSVLELYEIKEKHAFHVKLEQKNKLNTPTGYNSRFLFQPSKSHKGWFLPENHQCRKIGWPIEKNNFKQN